MIISFGNISRSMIFRSKTMCVCVYIYFKTMYIFKTWYILPDSSVGISHVVPLYIPSCGVYSVRLYLDQYQLLFYLKKSCNLKTFMWYNEIKWIQKAVKQTFLPFFLSSMFPHFPSAPISPSPTHFFTCTSISVYVYAFFPLSHKWDYMHLYLSLFT